jgi:long-subunit fatty acid transport protein
MKKQFLLISCLAFITSAVFGGGIVTNTNQSAYWVRTLVRDAAIGPDAVFFNPAGLTKLEDGFHFSLNSQTIFQNKDVENDYGNLIPSPKMYYGDLKAPFFPGFYATWKKNKIAVSFGFNPIGGGGGGTYEDGLPSFEQSISDLVPMVNALGGPLGVTTDAYRADIYFKGTSIYLGYQLGVTYQITDVISAYLGARYVTVKNTYEGYIRNVEVNPNDTWTEVSSTFTDFSDQYSGLATQATTGASFATTFSGTMGGLMGAGLPPTATLADAETAGANAVRAVPAVTAIGVDPTNGSGIKPTVAMQHHIPPRPVRLHASGQAAFAASLTSTPFNQV